ncbi:MAG: PD-(D/E)XK nuclease family protein [Oscillospiraceae bacterium]|nr:PD-(D/E)XK nuclease family protein [Oscillospiraceae bacterium]
MTFLNGTSHRANTAALLERVQQTAMQQHKKTILIVPEHLSHETERRLCMVCGNTVSRWVEAMSLSRFADRVFSDLGDANLHGVDQAGRVLLMYRAVSDLRSRLNHFHPGRMKAEFLLQLLELSTEFGRCAITPALLHQASATVNGSLAQKLDELSLIFQQYAAICEAEGIDPSQKLTRLAAFLPDAAFLADTQIMIDGFTGFSMQESAVIQGLCRYAMDVTIAMTVSGEEIFAPAARTQRHLIGELASKQIAYTVTQIAAPQDSALAQLPALLFSHGVAPYAGSSEEISLSECESAYEECLNAADTTLKLVREGMRFDEIQIACTALGQYAPLLQAVFERFSIPYTLNRADPVINRPIMRLVCAALDCVVYHYDTDDVLRYLKSGFAPAEQAMCDRMENYAMIWKLRGSGWTREWTMHPDGLSRDWRERDKARLASLEAARQACIAPLLQLEQALRSAPTAAKMVEALYQFCQTIDIAAQLQQDVNADALLSRQRAMESAQLYESLMQALEQFHHILGERTLQIPEFAQMMLLVLGQYTVAAIPPTADCVAIGEMHMMRQRAPKALLVLGAQEGLFPPYCAQGSILSDHERELLRKNGLTAFRCNADDTEEAMLTIYNLLSAPTAYLKISCCPQPAGESYLYRRIKLLLPKSVPETPLYTPLVLMSEQTSRARLFAMAKTQPEAAALLAPLEALHDEQMEHLANQYLSRGSQIYAPLSPDSVRALYGETLFLSASKIDRFASCRCAYFYEYGLAAKPRRAAEYDARELGTFVHAVLECAVRRVMDEGGYQRVTKQRAAEIASEEMARFVQEHPDDLSAQGARGQYLFSRNFSEVKAVTDELWSELNGSAFQPDRYELSFDADGDMPAVEIRGARAHALIHGFVDRVDKLRLNGKDFVRVIDYKTGAKQMDYTDILEGIGLQMLIYLFALEDNGAALYGSAPQAAGVLYVPAHCRILPQPRRLEAEEADVERAKEVRRSGLILDDAQVLSAMEQPELAPRYLPVKIANGTITGGDRATAQQLQQLKAYVVRTLCDMADQIVCGDVHPTPYQRDPTHGSCTYCDYAPACHFDAYGLAVRRLRKTPPDQFWETIVKENARYGRD